MEVEDCIFFQLSLAGRAGTRYWREQVAHLGVTSVQALVLDILYRDDNTTAKQLGKKTALDSATLTGILDRLEKAGFLKRQPDEEDRRAIRVCLTPPGREKGETIHSLIPQANQDFLSRLTPVEALVLRELLKKLHP